MGESNSNPNALMKRTMPTLPTVGRAYGVQFAVNVVLKDHVVTMPAERVRDIEGKRQVLASKQTPNEAGGVDIGPEQWLDVPEGQKVIILGQEEATPEDCLVTVFPVVFAQNTNIKTPNGQHPTAPVMMPGGAMDMREFIARTEGQLGGSAPALVLPT